MNQEVSDFSFHPLLTRLTYQGFPDLSHRYLDLLRVQTWTPMNSLFFFRFSKLAGILLFCLQKQHIKHQKNIWSNCCTEHSAFVQQQFLPLSYNGLAFFRSIGFKTITIFNENRSYVYFYIEIARTFGMFIEVLVTMFHKSLECENKENLLNLEISRSDFNLHLLYRINLHVKYVRSRN